MPSKPDSQVIQRDFNAICPTCNHVCHCEFDVKPGPLLESSIPYIHQDHDGICRDITSQDPDSGQYAFCNCTTCACPHAK